MNREESETWISPEIPEKPSKSYSVEVVHPKIFRPNVFDINVSSRVLSLASQEIHREYRPTKNLRRSISFRRMYFFLLLGYDQQLVTSVKF